MTDKVLPVPPEGLADGEVTLRFVRVVVPEESSREQQRTGQEPTASCGAPKTPETPEAPETAESAGLVPYYHFRIIDVDGTDVGHINFRVGDTEHVRVSAGHIGFEIADVFRRLRQKGGEPIASYGAPSSTGVSGDRAVCSVGLRGGHDYLRP